jgi:aminopeptidase N
MIKRLYDQFQPDLYRLILDINSEASKFKGAVTIEGNLIQAANSIELHSKDLVITLATIDGNEVSCNIKSDDVLELKSAASLKSGGHTVYIEFKGKITDQMHGIYPCYYDHLGKRKKLIATQFESHHAREVFPCIDEPGSKAVYEVELVTENGVEVLGNMPAIKQWTAKNRLRTRFEPTPKMSSYLLAFVIGELHCKEATTKDGVIVRSWATVAQDSSWLDFSIKEAVDYIEFFNDYFKTAYPLSKCDQVALPDFESGAMENWGLITYREVALLTDPDNPSLSSKQLIAEVVAHELSHQWFGNLVTMKWWDDLWLNESFANMISFLAVDKIHPEWKLWEDYVSNDAIAATNRDVYTDVQPVRVQVKHPSEITTLFDPAIVYAKGGKLLKALHDLLGDNVWREGLALYFKTHGYKNTSKDDLWASLQKASSLDVGKIMDVWIESPGLPKLTVEQTKNTLKISQQRLLLDGKDGDSTWSVPLIATVDIRPPMLSKKEQTFKLMSDTYVALNLSGFGHFVSDYKSADHKAYLSKMIADRSQPTVWKIQHLNELILLAKHGDTSLTEALDAVKYAAKEERASVWYLVSSIIGNARQFIEGSKRHEQLTKNLSFNLSTSNYKRLGWNYDASEASNTTHLRTAAISLMLSSEDEEAISIALSIYGKSKLKVDLPAELRSLLMSIAVKFGESHDFNDIIKLYKEAVSSEFKSDVAGALCSTKDEEQIKKLLDMMLNTKIVKTQDTMRWYVSLLRNKHARDLAWKWLKSNWNWVMENFGGGKSYDDFARYTAMFFSTPKQLKEYNAFFKPLSNDPTLKRTISIGVNEIKARVAWRERDEQNIKTWLDSNVKAK